MSWINRLASFAILATAAMIVFSIGQVYATPYLSPIVAHAAHAPFSGGYTILDYMNSPMLIHIVDEGAKKNVSVSIPAAKPIDGISSAPASSPVVSAQLIDGSTDKRSYKAGDSASGIVVLKNTGNVAINEVTISVTAYKLMPVVGYVEIGSKSMTLTNLHITPGMVKKLDKQVKLPGKYKGIVAQGDYKLDVTVSTGNVPIGSFTAYVTIS